MRVASMSMRISPQVGSAAGMAANEVPVIAREIAHGEPPAPLADWLLIAERLRPAGIEHIGSGRLPGIEVEREMVVAMVAEIDIDEAECPRT